MIVGILKEVKAEENRVALTPGGVEVMGQNGHTILVEKNAGRASGFEDALYKKNGAEIVDTPKKIFSRSEMIVRVKAPRPFEFDLLQENQIYFSYLHLAASENVTHAMIKSRSVNIAYETIQKANGTLPLLAGGQIPGDGSGRSRGFAGGCSRSGSGHGVDYRRWRGGHQCGQIGLRTGGQGLYPRH
jgi:alanine dehydrogenase